MKKIGYGKDYQYAHDLEEKVADMDCLPESLADTAILSADRPGNGAAIPRNHEDGPGKETTSSFPEMKRHLRSSSRLTNTTETQDTKKHQELLPLNSRGLPDCTAYTPTGPDRLCLSSRRPRNRRTRVK